MSIMSTQIGWLGLDLPFTGDLPHFAWQVSPPCYRLRRQNLFHGAPPLPP